MVTRLRRSEAEHLKTFGHFITDNNGMTEDLRAKRWVDFARKYNGKLYYLNQYDKKLKEAYLNHSAAPLLGNF